jgi:hypothetical protein
MGKTIVNSVPVYIPFFWADWIGDENVRMMTVGEQGIYLNFLIEQWVYDKVVIKGFARRINARRDAVQQWFKRWTRIVHCPYCDRTLDVQEAYAECTRHGQEAYNCKLRNLKNDVNSGVPLGHTETKPNQEETESKPNLTDMVPTEPDAKLEDIPALPEQGEEPQVPVPAPEEPKPASGKRPETVLANNYFLLLGKPRKHSKSAVEWESAMSDLLKRSDLSLDEFKLFLKWAVDENTQWKNSSVEFLRKAADPMANLVKHFDNLLDTYTRLHAAREKLQAAKEKESDAKREIRLKDAPAMNQPQNKADFYARNQAAMDEEEL